MNAIIDKLLFAANLQNKKHGRRLKEGSLTAGQKEVIKMNKKILMGIIALAVSLMFSSGLMAQGTASTATAVPSQNMKMELFNGVIRNVDMSTKNMVVEFQKDKMSFSLNDKTKVFDEGTKVLKLSDLKKGEWASVEYNKEGSQQIAQIIHVSPFQKSKHVAPAGNKTQKMMSAEKAPKTSLNW